MSEPFFVPRLNDSKDIEVVHRKASEGHNLVAFFVNGFGVEHILLTLNHLERSRGQGYEWTLESLDKELAD